MSGNWLVLLLVVVNLPVLFFLVWVFFDDVREARGQLAKGVAMALLSVFSLGLFKKFFLDDEDDSFLNSIGVVVGYAIVVAGEYWAIAKCLPSMITAPFSLL